MKTFFLSSLILASAVALHAQGVFNFSVYLHGTNAVPISYTDRTGQGTMALTGNVLSYEITTPVINGFRSQIYGPAPPGMNAPALFALMVERCELPPLPPYCLFRG